MNCCQRAKKHRWARKVFSRHTKFSKSKKYSSRKKAFKCCRIKNLQIINSGGKKKTKKFKLNANILTITPYYMEERARLLSFFDEVHDFLLDEKNQKAYGAILLNCQKVEKIDPTGCAILFSYIEMFQELYPSINFQLKYPNKIKRHYGTDTIQPNHVLNHLNLYKQLNSPKAPTCHTLPPSNLKIWETNSFANSDSSLVGQILENVCKQERSISGTQIAKIYKILIEAVNNCPEHAYDETFMKAKGLSYAKTRCLFAIVEERLVVVVADLGVGIRYTLDNGKAKRTWAIFKRYMEINGMKNFSSKDSQYLDGMINIKNIRTRNTRHQDSDYRGYGGIDLKNAIVDLKGKLLIMSGKGSLMLDASDPKSFNLTPKDFDTGLKGTLLSISIPLTAY